MESNYFLALLHLELPVIKLLCLYCCAHPSLGGGSFVPSVQHDKTFEQRGVVLFQETC